MEPLSPKQNICDNNDNSNIEIQKSEINFIFIKETYYQETQKSTFSTHFSQNVNLLGDVITYEALLEEAKKTLDEESKKKTEYNESHNLQLAIPVDKDQYDALFSHPKSKGILDGKSPVYYKIPKTFADKQTFSLVNGFINLIENRSVLGNQLHSHPNIHPFNNILTTKIAFNVPDKDIKNYIESTGCTPKLPQRCISTKELHFIFQGGI
ncbi:hypothetical protein PPL_07685 [Heterostelium album PN500]|uniref:Uncharacterized protein n=1 Tax=Heterostelium pallidum (strain ATCC 26659 / Pp 5 / PN500) TaxID=670386 RepID=D3BGN3_HETP5|nr:hypothetical protein PPL_07685 [Heterostelium album PN500]EFA79267.1 hypothetical protein PPL_07685 [Heterostelium album PN500]|eukprot:XP_020431388.1 hypothetical protein PPL_07685 [Heterostelium album PN500]